jgi:hypothetical protein
MKSELVREVLSIIEDEVSRRPSGIEFEFAYQARVAVDCIRFAIKALEGSSKNSDELQQANLQLLDALDRLELAERSFQRRFRARHAGVSTDTPHHGVNGHSFARDVPQGV